MFGMWAKRAVLVGLFALWLHIPMRNLDAAPFTDKNLETAVRDVLREPKADLTDEKLKNVYVLEVDGKGIRDLTGLEKCKNLAQLKLSHNEISDVAPLAGLTKLQYLELSDNQISKVDPLKGLTSLSALYLTGNKVSD